MKQSAGQIQDVEGCFRHGTKAATLDQHRLSVQSFRWLQDLALRGEHRRAGQALLDQVEAGEAVVDLREARARESEQVDLDAVSAQIVQQRFRHQVRVVLQITGTVKEVHAENADRLLLPGVVAVEHPDMKHDLRRSRTRFVLEPDAHPSVPVLLSTVSAGRQRVGEHKEGRGGSSLRPEHLIQRSVFVLEHREQATPADVAVRRAVQGVTDGHVVGRHRLGNRAGRPADLEEPAGDLLAGSDLCKRPVARRVEIDLQSLVVRRRP